MVLLIGAALLRRTAAGRFPMHRAARLLQAAAVAWIALFLLMIAHSAYVEASRPSPVPPTSTPLSVPSATPANPPPLFQTSQMTRLFGLLAESLGRAAWLGFALAALSARAVLRADQAD